MGAGKSLTREDLLPSNDQEVSEHYERLERDYDRTKRDLAAALARLQTLEEGQAQVRLGYYKELIQLQDQIFIRTKDPN